MIEPKPIRIEAVPAALEEARHYREMNEPVEAESICLDILNIDPDNHEARVVLLMALTDDFGPSDDNDVRRARKHVRKLTGDYDRAFFTGIICERKGKAILRSGPREAGPAVYRWLTDAMDWYEKAADLGTTDNAEAVLRWNTCARLLNQHDHVRLPPGPPSGEWGSR